MQQDSGETEAPDEQQEQQSAPLRCPRCDSMDTKFRYYNNNDRGQPRHYCKTCRRYWTVGGSIRNIPFGGSGRNGKPAKVSSTEHMSHHPPPLMMAAVGSQIRSLSASIPPASSYDEISCLAAIQSLTQPHVDFRSVVLMNQPLPQNLPSYGGNPGHPNWWPIISPWPQDFNNNFSFAAANASIWNNFNGNNDDPDTATTSMNPNHWPKYLGPP